MFIKSKNRGVNLRFKKLSMLLLMALFLCSIIVPFATAAVPGPVETFTKVGEWILKIFNFEWVKSRGDDALGAFMRICIFILVYILLYLVSGLIPIFTGHSRARIVVAIIIGLISVIFITVDVLIAIGEVYSTLSSAAMFIIALGGVGYMYWRTWALPGRLWVALRFAVLFLMWILLSIITTAVGGGM